MMVKCVIYFFCPEYLQSTLMMELLVNNSNQYLVAIKTTL